MVQPVTSPYCFSCAASYSPCEWIYDIIRRVSTCVRGIFAAIATFITSWCSWAEVPLAPAAAPIIAPPTVIPTARPIAGAHEFLQARIDSFRNAFPGFDFRAAMGDTDRAHTFLTRLMVWDLAKDATSIPLPLPAFIAGTIEATQIENLRTTFNTLSEIDLPIARYNFVNGVPTNFSTSPFSNAASAVTFMQQADLIVNDFLNEHQLVEELPENVRTLFL